MTEPAITKAEFARRVGLARSRISQLVDAGMPVTSNGMIVESEGLAWMRDHLDAHRRDARKPSVEHPAGGSVSQLRAAKLAREAGILDIELKRRRGELVNRKEVERAAFDRARFDRDSWTGWSARAAQTLVAEAGGHPAATHAVLDRLVREHLAELAERPMEMVSDVV